MPNLDIRTLSFLAMLSCLLLAIGLQIVNRIITRDASLHLWAMGATATGLGFILLALRGVIPDLLSIVLANTLLVIGATWHYFGNRTFQSLKGASPWCWWLVAGTAVLFTYFTYFAPNLSARIVIISLVLAAIRFASAWALIRPAGGPDALVRWFIAIAYGVTAAFFCVRAVVSLSMSPTDQNFMATAGLVQTLAFIFETSLTAILGIGLPLLVLGRTHHLLEASERRYRNLSEWSPVPMGVHDGERLRYVNPAAIQLFGARSAQALLGKPVIELTHPAFRQIIMERGKAALESDQPNPMIEEKLLKLDGSVIDVEVTSIAVLYEGKPAVQFAMNDVTERKRMEDQVRQLAFHDPLTHLPNRRLLKDRLQQAMAASARSHCFGALIFLDLDNFKPLNDAHGHEAGDLLLIEAARRLNQCVREMDTVARFGGDEFVVVLSSLTTSRDESAASAELVAEKICTSLSAPYLLEVNNKETIGLEHHCTASIGIALFCGHEASQNEVISAADTAMYQAKESGRNQVFMAAETQALNKS